MCIWRILVCSLWCQLWYPLSKTLAEKAAWDFAKENGLDIVAVHPGLVMGPILPPTLNGSMRMVLRLIQGNRFELLIVRSLILEVANWVTDCQTSSYRYKWIGSSWSQTLCVPEVYILIDYLYYIKLLTYQLWFSFFSSSDFLSVSNWGKYMDWISKKGSSVSLRITLIHS